MNPEQTPAIEFRNVSISFDGAQALQNISFTLPRGSAYASPDDGGDPRQARCGRSMAAEPQD